MTGAPLSGDEFPFVGKYGGFQLVAAATLIAADLVRTAGCDPPAVYQNLDAPGGGYF